MAAAAVLAATCAQAQQKPSSLEFPIKAAFLYKFGSFVEWPASAFPGPTSPLILCVVGRDPFGPVLDRTVQGETVEGRAIAVRRMAAADASAGCHIAFLGGSADQSIAEAARALANAPVLTVTDAAPNSPGVIQFVIVANRVRFRIDQRGAGVAGLMISSKLLNLAVTVAK